MSKITMFLWVILATLSNVNAMEIIVSKQDDGWSVVRGAYVESFNHDQTSIFGTISQSWPFPFKSGSCHVRLLSDSFKDFNIKAKMSCEGSSFHVTFQQMGKDITTDELPVGQISIYMDQDQSGNATIAPSGNSSVPAKKGNPNHYQGRTDPSHER